MLHEMHVSNSRPIPFSQAAAAAAADCSEASADGNRSSGALSWTAALYTMAVLHAGPAAAAFAISAAFQHNACAPEAHDDPTAVSGHSVVGGTMQRLLGSSQGGVAAAAACVLATAVWRHARSAAAEPPIEVSAGSAAGKLTGGAGSERQRSPAGGGLLSRGGAAALGYRAALGGCGWRRLKAALLTAVVRHEQIHT
jgi:hypothetical protein